MERLISHICGEVGVLRANMIDIVKVLKTQNRQLGLIGISLIAGGIYIYQNEKDKVELKKEVEEMKQTKGE